MKKKFIQLTLLFLCWAASPGASAQSPWSLQQCIDYALENSIQLQMKQLSLQSSQVDVLQSRAAVYPTLNFGNNNSFSFQNTASYNEYNEAGNNATMQNTFSLSSSMTLFAGGKLRNSIRQAEAAAESAGYDVEQQKFDLQLSIITAYLQILYDKEALSLKESTAQLSKAELERGEALYGSGAISKVELKQLSAQNASDNYSVVLARTSLETDRLSLKQLLELGPDEEFDISYDNADYVQLEALPTLQQAYEAALESLPMMRGSESDIAAAEYALSAAKGSYLPSLSLGAAAGTSYQSGTGISFVDQVNKKLSESVSLNLSVPIFNGRQVRSSVEKAEINLSNARLQSESVRKQILSTVESAYNDAVAAEAQMSSATVQMEEATESYNLASEQFAAGIKNTVELLSALNNYRSASSSLLQARYKALLSEKILKLYMNN